MDGLLAAFEYRGGSRGMRRGGCGEREKGMLGGLVAKWFVGAPDSFQRQYATELLQGRVACRAGLPVALLDTGTGNL